NGDLVGIAGGKALEQLVIVLIANTHNDKLYALGQQGLQDLREQIKALLIGQAGNHRQQWDILTHGQMRLLLQGGFIGSALLKGRYSEWRMNIVIDGGIEFLIIDAIENAEEAIAA